jgi:DegV family protein with EDD domain
MTIKVITDSTSDISPDLAKELDIRVVPIYIRFGDKIYRDRVDIQNSEFYKMLQTSPTHPATSQPNPEDFAGVFSECLKTSDSIVSIHISSRISGTFNSASLAKKMLRESQAIEVIDSKFNSAGSGLVVLAAARLAQAGAGFTDVVNEAKQAISHTRMYGIFKTMKYLARSGRVNKAIATASRILNVMPLLTFRDGEIIRAGLVRTINKGMDNIYDFVKRNTPITEITIVHSEVAEQANKLKQRLGEFIQKEKITITELGAGLGVHGGPGVLLVALRKSKEIV